MDIDDIISLIFYNAFQIVIVMAGSAISWVLKRDIRKEGYWNDYIDANSIVFVYKKDILRTYFLNIFAIFLSFIVYAGTISILIYINTATNNELLAIVITSIVYIVCLIAHIFHIILRILDLKEKNMWTYKKDAAMLFKSELEKLDIEQYIDDFDLAEMVKELQIPRYYEFFLIVGDKYVFRKYRKKMIKLYKSNISIERKYFKLLRLFISSVRSMKISELSVKNFDNSERYLKALFDKFLYYVNHYFILGFEE